MSREYRLIQDKLTVAQVSGPFARAEINHYAMMYGKDGPVRIQFKTLGGKWVNAKQEE